MAGSFGMIEIKDSRVWSFEDVTETTLTAVYLAWWEPGLPTDIYPGDGAVMTQTGMPMVQTRPPAAIHTPPGTSMNTFLANMICRSVTATPEPAVPYTWRVTAVYASTVPVDTSKQGQGVRYTRQLSPRHYAEYRTGVTPPSAGTAAWPPTADIGGTKVDLHGVPRAKEATQIVLQVEYRHDRTPLMTTPTVAIEPTWGTFYTAINKRNSTAFLDQVPGTLLYKGCSAVLDREIYRLTHTWIFDPYYHLEQMPVPNASGQPILLPGVSIAGQQIGQTEKVGWYQRYPDTVDFTSSFLPTNIYGDLGKSYPPALF